MKTTTVPHEGPWNGRRIGKVEKQREAKDYIRAQEEDLIGLVETKGGQNYQMLRKGL